MEDVRYYHPDNMDLIEWHDKIRKDISALDEKNIHTLYSMPQHFSQGAHDFSHWGEWRL